MLNLEILSKLEILFQIYNQYGFHCNYADNHYLCGSDLESNASLL